MKIQLPHRQSPRRAQAGVTLVETSIVASVLAVMASLAVPSFQDAVQRRHLEGAANQLETDIHYTRMMAVARNVPMRISFEAGSTGSCYVIHTGAAGQCSCAGAGAGTAVCQGAAQAERSVFLPADGPVSLRLNSRSVVFDAMKGTSTPTATMQLTARNGMTVRQVMNIMGRVRSCSPAPALSGYRPC
jgi:type IV fimbrial biogenesis protein FimT